MTPRQRAFTEQFVLYMHRRGGFPGEKETQAWFKSRGPYTTGVYTKLKQGKFVAEKYTAAFIELLVSNPDTFELQLKTRKRYMDIRQSRRALLDFLRDRGIQSLTQVSVDGILAHVCSPSIDKKSSVIDMVDHITRGVTTFSEFVFSEVKIDKYLRACRDENDVFESLRWMFIRVSQCVYPEGPGMADDEAVRAAGKYMQITFDEYAKLAIAWWRFNPWTIVRAMHKAEAVGMTIMLPVSEKAYKDVVDGHRPTYDCVPEDFTSPCRTVIVEGCAENPAYLGVPGVNPTKPMELCTGFQLAAISRCHKLKRPRVLRALSFAGTPTNRERLLATHFRPTGGTMARTGTELYEREFRLGSLAGTQFMANSLLLFFSKKCPPVPKG